MNVCIKCLTLAGIEELYCPYCKVVINSHQKRDMHKMTTFKTGRLRTIPSKVYHNN